MDRLKIKATDGKYQEYDRKLKEPFINGLNNETIIAKIIKELTALKDTSKIKQCPGFNVGPESENQKAQKAVFDKWDM